MTKCFDRNAYMRAYSKRPDVRAKIAVRDKRWRDAKRKAEPVSHGRLTELLSYDAATGEFTWLVRRGGSRENMSAGAQQKDTGYIRINIDARLYAAHRLAWFYTYGKWPIGEIDHINGNRVDNRISNLREATRRNNALNSRKRASNTSGAKGVSWCPRRKTWYARIKVNGRTKWLGQFSELDQASQAYRDAATKYHGPFARFE